MGQIKTELVVIGAGPGGYEAAFRAADNGLKVVLVEKDKLGGVCLNAGCIPSKAFLQCAHLLRETKDAEKKGILFSEPKIDLAKMREWKEGIVQRLSKGIALQAKSKNIEIIYGRAEFESSESLRVETKEGIIKINFEKCIVATGSKPAIPDSLLIDHPNLMTSTEALALENIPEKLLIIGGGFIGIELGTIYSALGTSVTVVEALPQILTGIDPDLLSPLMRSLKKQFEGIRVSTQVTELKEAGNKIRVVMESEKGKIEEEYDKVLVSIGRLPNTDGLGLERTIVTRNDKGFINVDKNQETADPNILAIGDITDGLLLAHKATKDAHIAVDYISGKVDEDKDYIIPSVVYTDPEIAWCGLTEEAARAKNIAHKVKTFSWAGSGKAVVLGQTQGLTKLIVDPISEKILGVGIVGNGAGELISEGVLAVEKELTSKELANIVHPHPTLSETFIG